MNILWKKYHLIILICKLYLNFQFYNYKSKAAYSILNISTRSKEYSKKFPEEEILPVFINIVHNTQDVELAQLGMKYLAWELENNKEVN